MSTKVADGGRPADDISVPMLLWCNYTGHTQASSRYRGETSNPFM